MLRSPYLLRSALGSQPLHVARLSLARQIPALGEIPRRTYVPQRPSLLNVHRMDSTRFYYTIPHSAISLRDDAPGKSLEDKKKQEEKLSKVEMAVQVQKEIHDREDEDEEDEDPKEKEKHAESQKKLTTWQKVKNVLHHYWVGSKLLATDFRVSGRLVMQILKGKELTRRERKQLLRTTADMFRLVPFIVILIVPFAEFALPVLLSLFPNMLPSTFEEKYAKEEKKKKLLQARLETARFLQDSLEEMALVSKTTDDSISKAFNSFFKQIRSTGQQASNKDLLLFSKFFKDELTLDNLSRPQIVSMCKYMSINAFGTTPFLRYQLRKRFKQLKEDDLLIQKEGVESLNVSELQQACQSRGMRTTGVSSKRLRSELQQWIDLRLKEGIPGSLLVLARAFMIQDQVVQPSNADISTALQAALSSLPDEVVKEVHLDVSEIEGKFENEKKLDLIKEQEELIKEEKEEEEEAVETDLSLQERIRKAKAKAAEVHGDLQAEGQLLKEIRSLRSQHLTKDEIASLSDAVNMLSSSSIVTEERDELEKLKSDHQDFVVGVEGLKNVPQLELSKASSRLTKGVQNMIKKIDQELHKVEKEGSSIKVINPDFGGEISYSDLEKALQTLKNRPQNPEGLKRLLEAIDKNKDGRISIEELEAYADSLEEQEGIGHVEGEKDKEAK